MKLNSFVITIKDLFLPENDAERTFNFEKLQYVIPKYQREYKWKTDKIETFYTDIFNRDKFIGNIILNKTNNSYEIVDGQQRLTTILLILVALFNHDKNIASESNGLTEEQKEILSYLSTDDLYSNIVIKNETIGKYLHLNERKIYIKIEKENDIYYQKASFQEAYETIMNELKGIDTSKGLRDFKNKLLDCKMLVLVGEKEGENDSVEDLFLDINFKSQLLDVEDIFKGYCFKNYNLNSHDVLKGQWTDIKRNIKLFEDLGYKNKNTCEYIYLYLLSFANFKNITETLSINGRHCLEDKNHTETQNIVLDMISYGNDIIELKKNLNCDDYLFEDISSGSVKYNNNTEINKSIKKILKSIVLYKSAQYYKLPLFMLIHALKQNNILKNALSYDDFRKIVSNYCVYSFLFLSKRKDKSKVLINREIFEALDALKANIIDVNTCIDKIVKATKNLRKTGLDDYEIFEKFEELKAYPFYSILDFYDLSKNYLNMLYTKGDYTKEHLLIHNNRKSKITWEDEKLNIKVELVGGELLDESNKYKMMTSNYIIVPKNLNENILGQMDIVSKIKKIKEHYNKENKNLPKHIEIFINFIESMPEYQELKDMKGVEIDKEVIKEKYKNFLNAYFSIENQENLYGILEEAFKEVFMDKNNK